MPQMLLFIRNGFSSTRCPDRTSPSAEACGTRSDLLGGRGGRRGESNEFLFHGRRVWHDRRGTTGCRRERPGNRLRPHLAHLHLHLPRPRPGRARGRGQRAQAQDVPSQLSRKKSMLRLKEAPKYVQFSTRSQERHCRLKLPTVLALGEEAGGWAGPEGAGPAPAVSPGPALTPVPPPSPPGSNARERPLLAPGAAGRCAPCGSCQHVRRVRPPRSPTPLFRPVHVPEGRGARCCVTTWRPRPPRPGVCAPVPISPGRWAL